MTKVNIPTFKLNNGREIPVLGYGTWLGISETVERDADPSKPSLLDFAATDVPKMMETLSYAIDIGYRHIDTAHFYRVEPEIGQVINKKIQEGVVKREELFVTTKVWQHFHREADVEVSIRGSLKRTNLDYFDMVIIHWPMSISQTGEDEKIDVVETWRGLEKACEKGLTKSIGLSNFNEEQVKRILANCKIPPSYLQTELNLNLGQTELVKLCTAHKMVVVAYSPFGTMVPSRAAPNSPEPKINHPTLQAMSKKYGKTPTQLALRYLYQRGLVSIPKTITKTRVVENASIFDFALDAEDVATLAKFDNGYRTVRPTFWQDYTNYPFDKVPAEKEEIPPSFLVWKCGINQDID